MTADSSYTKPILLVGQGRLAESIALCLLKAGRLVYFCTDDVRKARSALLKYVSEMNNCNAAVRVEEITFLAELNSTIDCEMAIVISDEDLMAKKRMLVSLEEHLSVDTIIAINTETIRLDEIQQNCLHPQRLIGINWTEPAHTTRFLEIIKNSQTADAVLENAQALAKAWSKDAYVVVNLGVRSRMLSAMIREAFYLVENGYASAEDIDRACRNDAGYYLPFAGNCRYMDLMGTYAYGMVMKDLNPVLSQEMVLPAFFVNMLNEGSFGIENERGFYTYTLEEAKQLQNTFREFSYHIEEIIDKYPFNYQPNGTHA